jgi:hypothetical protein
VGARLPRLESERAEGRRNSRFDRRRIEHATICPALLATAKDRGPRISLSSSESERTASDFEHKILIFLYVKFYVEVDGESLVRWLNGASGTKSADRVKRILWEIHDLKAAFRSNGPRFLKPGPVHPVTQEERELRDENTNIMRNLDVRLKTVDKALTGYVFRPRATWFWPDRRLDA